MSQKKDKEKGQTEPQRQTKGRRAIREILERATKPLSAMEILEQLTKQKQTVDKVTVYRELEALQKQKMIVPVQLNDRKAYYELTDTHHHHHLVCESCHRVEDIDLDEDVASQERRILKQKGFKVTRHSLEFFGLCKDCR